jgi:hypothetical protein
VAPKGPRKNILFETPATLRRTGEQHERDESDDMVADSDLQNADGGAEPTLLAVT